MKTIKWLYWHIFYLLFPRKQYSLEQYVIKLLRLKPPWRKFKPNVHYNEQGKIWHICLDSEVSVTQSGFIPVELHIGQETGKIVGFDVLEGDLVPNTDISEKPLFSQD